MVATLMAGVYLAWRVARMGGFLLLDRGAAIIMTVVSLSGSSGCGPDASASWAVRSETA
jgi:hypothetical protein